MYIMVSNYIHYYVRTYVYFTQSCFPFIVHIQCSLSLSPGDSVCITGVFEESITITKAYTMLFTQLGKILEHCNVVNLKGALFSQVDTPDGVELGEQLEKQIDQAETSTQLLYALRRSHCCNWLDTRLLEVLADNSQSSSAINLIKAYWRHLSPKKLLDVLSKKSKDTEAKKDYIDAVHAKTNMDPSKITVKDFLKYQWNIEDVILDLGKKVLNIENVEKGCLEISYHISSKYSLAAYKMAIHNRYKFCAINLMHIEIADHPLIYDPCFPDLGTYSVKETMNSEQKS